MAELKVAKWMLSDGTKHHAGDWKLGSVAGNCVKCNDRGYHSCLITSIFLSVSCFSIVLHRTQTAYCGKKETIPASLGESMTTTYFRGVDNSISIEFQGISQYKGSAFILSSLACINHVSLYSITWTRIFGSVAHSKIVVTELWSW